RPHYRLPGEIVRGLMLAPPPLAPCAPSTAAREARYSDHLGAGPRELLEGASAVLGIDPAHGAGGDRDLKPRLQRVECGVTHAYVGGEPGEGEVINASLAEQLEQPRRFERRISRRARRGAFVDQQVDRVALQAGVELGALGIAHAVLRPGTALAAEGVVVR